MGNDMITVVGQTIGYGIKPVVLIIVGCYVLVTVGELFVHRYKLKLAERLQEEMYRRKTEDEQ